MQNIDFNNVEFSQQYKVFSECADEVLDKVAPVITKTLSNTSQPPWMDLEYRQERVTRRKLERSWKRSRNAEDKLLYIAQRKKCAQLATSKRSMFYSNLIEKKRGDQNALFKIVSTLLDKQKTSGTLPEFRDPNVLANTFNDFYYNKVKKIRENIKPSNLQSDFRKVFSGNIYGVLQAHHS